MKKFFVNVLVLALLAGFVSCNNDDPAPESMGDAYVISRLVVDEETEEQVVVYGLQLDAYPVYGTLTSVKAKVGTTEYTLQKNNDTGSFHYKQDEDEYSPDWEGDGTYTFNYSYSTGEVFSSTDAVTDDVLVPATITKSDFTENKIEVEWDELEWGTSDNGAIYVQLKEADGDIVFTSRPNSYSYLDEDETEYAISKTSGNGYWVNGYTPTSGNTYTVEVIAVLGGDVFLQAMSVATATVVWGE